MGAGRGRSVAGGGAAVNRRALWPLLVLVIWSAWIYAMLGRVAREPILHGFLPDLGLVLLLGLEPRMRAREARLAALAVAAARAAFSADPPTAVLVTTWTAVEVSRGLRHVVEAEAALVRALLAGLLALASGGFLALVHAVRLRGVAAGALELPVDAVLRGAVATSLAALLFLPLLVRLPGLTALAPRDRRRMA